jgi:hypothetical protein
MVQFATSGELQSSKMKPEVITFYRPDSSKCHLVRADSISTDHPSYVSHTDDEVVIRNHYCDLQFFGGNTDETHTFPRSFEDAKAERLSVLYDHEDSIRNAIVEALSQTKATNE